MDTQCNINPNKDNNLRGNCDAILSPTLCGRYMVEVNEKDKSELSVKSHIGSVLGRTLLYNDSKKLICNLDQFFWSIEISVARLFLKLLQIQPIDG